MTKRTLPECLTAPLKADEVAMIQMATKLILDEMKALHGGIWSSYIDHEVGFVLIRAHGDMPAQRSATKGGTV